MQVATTTCELSLLLCVCVWQTGHKWHNPFIIACSSWKL